MYIIYIADKASGNIIRLYINISVNQIIIHVIHTEPVYISKTLQHSRRDAYRIFQLLIPFLYIYFCM